VKLDLLLNGERGCAVVIVHGSRLRVGRAGEPAQGTSRARCPIAIQASIGASHRARDDLALRKNDREVLGGDISRKRKLLEKQKKQARMKQIGTVEFRRRHFWRSQVDR